jgi:hypothetical protein
MILILADEISDKFLVAADVIHSRNTQKISHSSPPIRQSSQTNDSRKFNKGQDSRRKYS